MKTIFATLIILTSLSGTKTSKTFNVDITKSNIKWSCDYVFYFNGHHGTIDFKEGYFVKEADKITGGEFIIDMNSIICLDIGDQESNESLVNHIKDPDFFNVPKFPTSKLVITAVKYHDESSMEVSAKLEIKSVSQPIRFQAKLNKDTNMFLAKFKIDRTRWGINYNSDIKDGAISDAIGFEVQLSY